MKFKVRNIVEKKDGKYLQEGKVDIEVTTELRTIIRGHYKRKRCTIKLIEKFINEGIQTVQLFRK